MDEPRPSRREPDPGRPWAVAFGVVASIAILVGGSLYVFRSLLNLPGDVASKTQEVLKDIQEVAAAFRQGTIETTFVSYAASVTGSNFLQFATLRQTEVFTREDRASILWGQMELPDVVVSATAPVEYTAYLDLNDRWEFILEDKAIYVVAPEIKFNKPAIDASMIRYEVRESSLLRDEEEAIQKLKEGLTAMSIARAREHKSLVREMGRRQTEQFVENWLVGAFADGADYEVEVIFSDERGMLPTPGDTPIETNPLGN